MVLFGVILAIVGSSMLIADAIKAQTAQIKRGNDLIEGKFTSNENYNGDKN